MASLRFLPAKMSRAFGAQSTRFAISALVLLQLLASSCTPGGTSTPIPPSITPGIESEPRQIRFALIGGVTKANVWALFDSQGYSYNNYAVRAEYWPRLFDLSIPGNLVEAVTANNLPSDIRQEGDFYTATVPLREDLKWTNGSPFTATDVAFTVNTAVKFGLGFDWRDHYNPEWLDHAEALEPGVVKFFFRRQPNVGIWQYGALQGPIVQAEYWESKVAGARSLLPPDDFRSNTDRLKAKIADLQAQVDAIYVAMLTAGPEQTRQLQADLRRQQGNLDEATNDLAKSQAAFDEARKAARAFLYELDDSAEPRLGRWQPITPGVLSPASLVENEVNPNFPGSISAFQRAVYKSYETREAARTALDLGEVDVILDPKSTSIENPAQHGMTSPNRSLRFLVFNLRSSTLARTPLRQALACMLDQQEILTRLNGRAAYLASFISPEEGLWYSQEALLPCHGMDGTTRLEMAVKMLKQAGFTWQKEPADQIAGQGLTDPDGILLPNMILWSPSSDDLRASAAEYIQQQAHRLGLPLTAQSVGSDLIDYGVFSSQRFEMALLGWRVGNYPGYLCDWFAVGKPFHYDPSSLTSACGELAETSDLEAARGVLNEIQSILAQDVPFVPLYRGLVQDEYRNVAYPFPSVLDGLTGAFGAPNLALPAAP